jgi:ABC-type branched-subunit amino acid transport system substrate-binding protein
LVPYAVVDAGAATEVLAIQVGDRLGFGIPRHMTPDCFPRFLLLRDMVGAVVARATGRGPEPGATALRDFAYGERVKRGGLPSWLWAAGGGAAEPVAGAWGWLVNWLGRPLTRTLPRWLWARRQTHQLIRPAWWALRREPRWLGTEQNVHGGSEDLFRVLDNLSQQQVPRLQPPAQDDGPARENREKALFVLERLLLRALLEDLSNPRTGKVRPERRRRTARPVVLVPIPPYTAGSENAAARRVERFLAAFHDAHRAAHAPGPLVIAVGRPADGLLDQIGPVRDASLAQAGDLLREPGDGQPVLTSLTRESLDRPGRIIEEVGPRTFRLSRRAVTSFLVGGTAMATAAFLLAIPPMRASSPDGCVGGTDTVAESAPANQIQTDPTKWYDAAIKVIEEQNQQAMAFARSGRTVRTVVAFVSNRPTSPMDTLFDGTIPELRGIAMWQQKLNQDANANRTEVPLLVDVRETGVAFHDAEQKARDLVDEIAHSNGLPAYRQIIGVLGYAQSRDETKAALKVLDRAKIIAIGTTATADEMLGEADYWPLTPLNSREAAIEADFAESSGIVARTGSEGGCDTAERAVVIESYGDLYSRSLAAQFMTYFTGQEQPINFTQDRGTSPESPPGTPSYTDPTELAGRVCEEITRQPDTVVYWSARAADFTAFINAFDTQHTCTGNDLTVLGGNELTNVAQTGAFDNKQWLRLYYSAHRLPATDPRASDVTQNFVKEYNAFVQRTTPGADPWVDDGHSAVAYDAFHVLSRVADMTYGSDPGARPADMENLFRVGGVTFNGATGYVDYAEGVNQPPDDKTLVILRQTGAGLEAVTVCGAYQQGQSSAAQGRPCSEAPR